MTVQFKKRASIADAHGILFTDPIYGEDVPFRYLLDRPLKGWSMKFKASETREDGFAWVDFALVLAANPLMEGLVDVSDAFDGISYSPSFEMSDFEIGMDSASVYCGDPVAAGDAPALSTGTDGLFGTAYQFKFKGQVVAVALVGSVDSLFARPESLFAWLSGNFNAVEAE